MAISLPDIEQCPICDRTLLHYKNIFDKDRSSCEERKVYGYVVTTHFYHSSKSELIRYKDFFVYIVARDRQNDIHCVITSYDNICLYSTVIESDTISNFYNISYIQNLLILT